MNGEQFLTTPAMLDRIAGDLPDHEALVTEDRVMTFGQLRAEARRAAAALIALGIEPGDRVAIALPNSWHWVVACLATHYAGAVIVPLNTSFTDMESADILQRSRVRLLFSHSTFDRSALPELRHLLSVPELLSGPAAELAEVDARASAVRPDDVADILFTSGTTGRSKGVLCSHRQSLSASGVVASYHRRTTADRYLCTVPFFHNYGYKDGILGCLQTGATLITQRVFDPEQAMRLIAEQRVTILPGPPTLFQLLLDHPARKDYDLGSLRLVTTGGTMVSPTLVRRISDELGVDDVRTGYGLTEASGYGTSRRWGDGGTGCGRPIAGSELRIADPDENGVGEILLRGPNVMLGYLDDPAATAAVIDDDGWLHTGDLGRVDADGNLQITDRLTDLYICGGLNVYPAEVEQVLARMEGIAEAAVIGVPEPRLGEVGRAFVVARPDADVYPQMVIAHARGHLAPYKVPRSVVFLDSLPRNRSGKVLKTVLREIVPEPSPPIRPRGLGGPPVGKVENWIADAWQVLLNIERPGRRDRFVDLGGDSVAAVEFSNMLEEQFGVSMSVDRLAERPTIAAVVADLQAGEGQRHQPVVRLRTDGVGPVCLMVPGIGGHAWAFVSLARALSVPCDVWALSLMDLAAEPARQMRDRIREAALAALRPLAAAGRPIVVTGYSFGGMVAADLACWLVDQGLPVAKVVLLDPDPLDSGDEHWDPDTTHVTLDAVVFVPGSAAARQLDAEINAVAKLLQAAYLDGSVRLPRTKIALLQTPRIAAKHESATEVFGTPIAEMETTMIQVGHLAMLNIPGVSLVAPWVDRQLSF